MYFGYMYYCQCFLYCLNCFIIKLKLLKLALFYKQFLITGYLFVLTLYLGLQPVTFTFKINAIYVIYNAVN